MSGFYRRLFKTSISHVDDVLKEASWKISFFLFFFSIIGFFSQGLVDYFWGNLIVPPQVILVYISFFFLLFSSNLNLISIRFLTIPLLILAIIVFIEIKAFSNISSIIRSIHLFTGIIIAIISHHIALKRKWMIILIHLIFFMVCLNAFAGLYEVFWDNILPWSVYYQTNYKNICVGFEYSPVTLGYMLVAPCTIAFILSFSGINQGIHKIFTFLTFILGVIVLFYTGSRSAILGLLVGALAGSAMLIQKKYFIRYIIAYALITIGIISLPFVSYQLKLKITEDNRFGVNIKEFLPFIIVNPFADNNMTKEEMETRIRQDLGIFNINKNQSSLVSYETPHNSFLLLGKNYGLIPLILSLLFFTILFLKGLLISNNKALPPDYRLWSNSLLGALLAFFIHSFFHHAGLFIGEMRGWIYVGLLSGFLNSNVWEFKEKK